MRFLKIYLNYFFFIVLIFNSLHLNAQIVFSGNVQLNSQANVTAFTAGNYDVINGNIIIRGNDITDLSGFNTLDTVNGSIFIEFNHMLQKLKGFDNLELVDGSLFIQNNYELDSILTFGMLRMVKGVFVLRHNVELKTCCNFFPLITGQQGVIWGGSIIEGNWGCKTEQELYQNCDDDTDNDGTSDQDDGCPNDPDKTDPGDCGCGNSEQDTDKDGTPDCNDECPNDAGTLKGCPDSDGDGVADKDDECPNNAGITQAGVCGCQSPKILDMVLSDVSNCNDKGSATSLDDSFTATVTITFEAAPTQGAVVLTGDASARVDFESKATETVYVLENLEFKATGEKINLLAEYKGNEVCNYTFTSNITAPAACSSGECARPGNVKVEIDEIANTATVSWDAQGLGVTYEFSSRKAGSSVWNVRNLTNNQILLIGLDFFTEYEYQIRSFCDGEKYSDYTSGSFISGGDDCTLYKAEVQSTKCQNNATPDDPSDDYWTFDLYVKGVSVGDYYVVNPVFGNQEGQYGEVQTFRTAPGTAGQGDLEITIIDSNDPECQEEVLLKDPGICNVNCSIQYLTIDRIFRCGDRGTRWTQRDDYYTAHITVYFSNPPDKGELELSGRFWKVNSVDAWDLQNSTTHTFKNVRLPADGNEVAIKASFTGLEDCQYETNFRGVLLRDNICKDQCNIIGAEILYNECLDGGTSGQTNDDFLSFELLVTGVNLGDSYTVDGVDGFNQGTYNQASYFKTKPGSAGQDVMLTIRDNKDDQCQFILEIDALSCSNLQIEGINSNARKAGLDPSVKLFPNPAMDEIRLDWDFSNHENQLARVGIYDLLSKEVFKKVNIEPNTSLNISSLPKGVYLAFIQIGERHYTRKIIKQ